MKKFLQKLISFILVFAVCAGLTATFSPPAAFACSGELQVAEQPAKHLVVFYEATHPSVRCRWEWGDESTSIQKVRIPLKAARLALEDLKKSSKKESGFKNHGSWFEYRKDGDYFAVGYYTQGGKPFVEPEENK
jgi:hypothetical protein